MDRRFLTWLMLTTALWFLYLSFRPRPQLPDQAPDPAAQADPLMDPLNAEQPPAQDPEQAEIQAPEDLEAIQAPSNELQTITLGSMAPDQGYNLLVTLTSQGAGLERAELIERRPSGKFRYRALEHKGGYLGYLKLNEDKVVQTVPAGSPAALATSTDAEGGIRPQDRILEVAGTQLTAGWTLDAALAETKPGDVVTIQVARGEQTLSYTTTLAEAPLDIIRANPRVAGQVEGNKPIPSLRTTVASLNGNNIPPGLNSFQSLEPTLKANWETLPLQVEGGQGVEFRLPLDAYLAPSPGPKKFDLVKRYRLFPKSEGQDGYLLDVETVLVNRNDSPVKLSLRQEGLNGLSLEGWWFSVKISPAMFAAAGARDVAYFSKSHHLESARTINDYARKHEQDPDKVLFATGDPLENRSLSYIGSDSQYFNASMLEHPDAPGALADLQMAAVTAQADAEAIHRHKRQATNTGFWFDTPEAEIAPGQQLVKRYQIFIGPKDSELLAPHGLSTTIEYGWFGWVGKPLGMILHFFHSLVRNYGIAIIMLTICVRCLLFPFTRHAMISSQKMQARMKVLQPEMKKINEKYKDDFEKRGKAMQELYAKHDFNPAENLSGCLPMFFQLPVFMGLYRCLSVDVSLRQEALIPGLAWCSNLAGPDMFYDWSSWMPDLIAGKGTGWLGPYFNILPLVTVALFLVQQKMLMPPATDEQTAMTQKIMKFMTMFMGILFFKVPSGLCIYFITSSLWSIVERKLIKKSMPDTENGTATGVAGSNGQASQESSSKETAQSRRKDRSQRQKEEQEQKPSRFQEIRNLLDKPAQHSATQRNSGKRPGAKKTKKGRKKK